MFKPFQQKGFFIGDLIIGLSIKRREYFAGKAESRWFGGRALDAVEEGVKIRKQADQIKV